MKKVELSKIDQLLIELEGYGYDLIEQFYSQKYHYPIIVIEGEHRATDKDLDEVFSIMSQYTSGDVMHADYGAIEAHLYNL